MKFLKCIIAIIEKNFGSIIIAVAIIAAAMIYAYYNPYEKCKRDILSMNNPLLTNNTIYIARICSGSGILSN